MTNGAVLKIEGISKRFGSTLANDDISLTLSKGEILAVLGENGAGKTTLMSILFGHYVPDAGRIFVEGVELPHGTPRAAIRAGVGMVHQHFTLASNLTVLENIIAGTESMWSVRSKTAAARARLIGLTERFGLAVNPEARLGDLSVGEQQRVEILKALYNDARILILDEPTAVLTQIEAERLFATLKEMAAQGLSLIFISHKLNEVMATANRVVVLRNGKVVAERRPAETSKAELAELIVGRRVTRPMRIGAEPGDIALEARNITVKVDGVERLKNINFQLHAGEVLGIIGVSGNGQSALGQLLSGTLSQSSGDLLVFGETMIRPDVAQIIELGIGRVPEDRNREGAIGEMAIWENAVLERLSLFSRRGLVDQKAGVAFAQEIIKNFDIRGGAPTSRTRQLSGGNMQKLILGRNLHERPRILIAAQPARGLDEGAVASIHGRLLEARRQGTAILLISEDLDEALALADRFQAIVNGRLSTPVIASEANAQRLGLMMTGGWGSESHPGHAI
jgi:general nucleoside transport system ATP-binding protein